MITYYVESWRDWFVVRTQNKRMARSVGVREFGRGLVKAVRRATKAEIDYYIALKGPRAIYD